MKENRVEGGLGMGQASKNCSQLGQYLKNEEKREAMQNSAARTSQMEEAGVG